MTHNRNRASAGFTLVELMVTLSIAAVLLVVAVPSYQAYARNAAVSQVAANFANAVQLARANAMRLSRYTIVQWMNQDLGWVGVWRIYADLDRDLKFTAGTDVLIVEQGPAGDGVMGNGPDSTLEDRGTVADGYLQFNPAGFPRSESNGIAMGSVVFYLPGSRAAAVVYTNAGRVRNCDPKKASCRPA